MSKRVDSTKTSDIKKALDDELEFEADVQELEDKSDQRKTEPILILASDLFSNFATIC